MAKSSSPVAVVHLKNPSEPEIVQVVSVMLEAFGDGSLFYEFQKVWANEVIDPFTRILVWGDMPLLRYKFEANVRAALLAGAVYVAIVGPDVRDIVGAVVLFGPGQGLTSTDEQREMVRKQFFAIIPDDLRSWWLDHFIPTMERLSDTSLGPEFKLKQWHLLLFGVAPEHQQKGIGKTLMAAAEDRARTDGVSIVLETTNDLDITIYTRLGFHIKGEDKVTSPVGSSPIYQMMKTP